ncbi:hemolysin family protein [Halobacillus salinarum]|uniref:Hemolysin family protein n=1 Tax=Halobacillus salinarum TaxID=2932257 RepID=A0ABY4EGF7_9BACI|nr:hemolysin family protein [Halobacillus salinarum]UOQ43219.1 hemolysin family protein [Halobacillus salinarum]
MESTIKLLVVALLILFTAFFVASEFAIVKVRKTKLEARVKKGSKKAELALNMVNNLDNYLSACQLGITITALGIGWLGEPALDHILEPLLGNLEVPEAINQTISIAIAFFIITFLHVVLGELAPKTFAIQKAEAITLGVARPLIFFNKLMRPLIWLLNGSANIFVRMFGMETAKESDEVHSEEELRHILSQSYEQGEINRSEYTYVDRIFEFDNRTAKEIMIPRTEMAVVDINDSIHTVIRDMKQHGYTRYPVIDDDKDRVLGVIHMKEFFYENVEEHGTLEPFIRPVLKVFENIPIANLLVRMKKARTHLAVLIDEYGGTAGIVTVEDILEEIVGEIRDEFDYEEEREIKRLKNGHFLLEGKVSIQDVNDFFDAHLDHEDFDTISGWIYTQDFDAREGTVVYDRNLYFKVVDMEDGQIRKVEAWRAED